MYIDKPKKYGMPLALLFCHQMAVPYLRDA